MLRTHALLWSVLLLTQVLIAVGHEHGEERSIEALIDNFVTSVANGREVLWWDIKGERDILKEKPDFGRWKMAVTTGPIIYGKQTKVFSRAPDAGETWVYNNRYNKSITKNVAITLTQKHIYTWNVDETYTTKAMPNVTVGPPKSVNVKYATVATFSLRPGSGDTQIETTHMLLKHDATVKPRTYMRLAWTVSYVAKERPWTMTVTLQGSIAVWYKKKIDGHHLWFYPVDFLSGEGLQHIPGGGIQFTAKGTFTTVSPDGSACTVEDYDSDKGSVGPVRFLYRGV